MNIARKSLKIQFACLIIIVLALLSSGCATFTSYYYEYAEDEPKTIYDWGSISMRLRCEWRDLMNDRVCGTPYRLDFTASFNQEVTNGTLKITKLRLMDAEGNIVMDSEIEGLVIVKNSYRDCTKCLENWVWYDYVDIDKYIIDAIDDCDTCTKPSEWTDARASFSIAFLELKYIDHKVNLEFELTSDKLTTKESMEVEFRRNYAEHVNTLFLDFLAWF